MQHRDPTDMAGWLMLCVAIIVMLFAMIQEAKSHDIYEKWKSNDGLSCCNDGDCEAVPVREINGKPEVFIRNAWHPVPPEAFIPQDASDGQSHACYWGGKVRCFVPGTGS